MDTELEELTAKRDAARRVVAALTDARVEEEGQALRGRLVALEYEERKSFGGLNGDGVEGLRVTSEKLAVVARLRALEAVRGARSAQRQEAERGLRQATAMLAKALGCRHAERLAAVTPKIQEHMASVFKMLDSLEAARLGDQGEHKVGVAAAEGPLRDALNGVLVALGEPAHVSPQAAAEREAIAKADRERKRAENARLYAEEEARIKKAKGLGPDQRAKILAGARERLQIS